MPLILGPFLRHVGETSAVIWVQTARAAEVEILGCRASTFEVAGFHYALVVVDDLTPGSTTSYEVHVDDERVWPEPGSAFPPSVIRTRGPASATQNRVVFGSCRFPKSGDADFDARLGSDALDSYARRLATRSHAEWPDALLLLGDQVYADELAPPVRRKLAAPGRSADHPADEVVSYPEYERLYRQTWGDPEIRWILSTVPTAMIFDDHDIRDDWNTSSAWREAISAQPWWSERIRAGLASYWVYQHLGNLSPATLGHDDVYQAVINAEGDCWPLLREMADDADIEIDGRKGVRFSFRWDLGRSRLVMIDSRNGRVFGDGARKMLSDDEFDWLEHQLRDNLGEIDHLLVGTSLPWLLPPVLGDVEAVNEVTAGRNGWRGRVGEWVRQAADLEHWPAFAESFERLTSTIGGVASDRDHAPATVSVLSGDVHHSYVARVDLGADALASVHQLVCSPVHNHVPRYMRPLFKASWSTRAARFARRWARRRGAPDMPITWARSAGPLFGNTIATLHTAGRDARAVFEQPDEDGHLNTTADVALRVEDSRRDPLDSESLVE